MDDVETLNYDDLDNVQRYKIANSVYKIGF